MAGIYPASGGIDQEAFQLLLSHLKDRNDWAKISGFEEVPRQFFPFEDAAAFAKP